MTVWNMYFTAIWYNLQPFDTVRGHLVYFSVLVCLDQEKSGNPDPDDIRVLAEATLYKL
jgi:hypothetical protein